MDAWRLCDVGRRERLVGDSGRRYTGVMTTWHAYRSLAIITAWVLLGLVLGVLVTPETGSDWRPYLVATGVLTLYGCTYVAYLRDRRRKRTWA